MAYGLSFQVENKAASKGECLLPGRIRKMGQMMFLRVFCRVSGDADIKDTNHPRTRLSGTGVVVGDVGKNFIECRYSHLHFRKFVVPSR